MEKLKNAKKITLATLKNFAKRNKDCLFVKESSSFDGMQDCVVSVKNNWQKTTITDDCSYFQTGIEGVYTVGSSRDSFELYEDEEYVGIYIYNCCGSCYLATKKVKKEVEYIDFAELLKV